MIVPVLKYLDLEPIENNEDFSIAGCAYIGTNDEKEVNVFHFKVISHNRLSAVLDENDCFDARATFIVQAFDHTVFKNIMTGILEECLRSTWDEVVKAIERFFERNQENKQMMPFDEVIPNVENTI